MASQHDIDYDPEIAESKIEPLGSPGKRGVCLEMPEEVIGTDHDIEESKIEPLHKEGGYDPATAPPHPRKRGGSMKKAGGHGAARTQGSAAMLGEGPGEGLAETVNSSHIRPLRHPHETGKQ